MKKGSEQVNNYFSSVKLQAVHWTAVLRGEILSRLLLTALLLLSLFLTACSDTSNPSPPQTDPGIVQPLPAGYGSFTPIIAHNTSRTILPAAPALSDFTRFELKFTPVGDQGGALTIEQPYADSDVLEPVLLVAGTYNLIVSAYKVSGVAARGTLNNINITAEADKSGTVILYALFGEGAGTFTWNITLDISPITVKTAVMTIKDSNGAEQEPSVDLLTAAGRSRSLPSGLYTVVFTMESADDPPQTLKWNDLLYIYAELESKFSISFTAAHFTDTHWNVTFDENYAGGGSSEESVMHGAAVSASSAPSRTGYTFGGWYREAAAVTLWDFDESVTDNVILYAKWTANTYTVTFNKNNTDSGSTDANPSTKTVTYPVTTVDALPTAPTRIGATFNGWNTRADGKGTAFVQTMAVTASITVYAQWKIDFFTSIAAFKAWLDVQDTNIPATAYEIKLNVGNLGGASYTNGSAGDALGSNRTKYVSLDLSGSNITSIGDLAFYNCENLTGVTIPNSVTSIGAYAFYDCGNLTSITIPNSVTSIGEYAFGGCTSLNLTWYYNPAVSITADMQSYLKTVIIPNGVESIGNNAFWYCDSLTSVTIGNSVKSIGDRAFYGCASLTSVTIGNSVKSIGTQAFYNCISLKSVTIPNSVTSIEGEAFASCRGLTSVTIPSSVTSIGEEAFFECTGLTSVTIPNSVKTIERATFAYCTNLKSVTIPNSVTSIGNGAFAGCESLTSVNIPSSVSNIGGSVFYDCASLTAITVDAANTAYSSDNGVLYNKNKSWLYTYPPGKTGAFTIPNSVTEILMGAFIECTGLTSVTIPNSVKVIGTEAFYGCTSLISVTFQGTINISDFTSYAFGYSGQPGYIGDLRAKFYATNTANGTPGTYTRAAGGSTWTKI
jgi:uncharacterized repeat protein (TIGR02543 family)